MRHALTSLGIAFIIMLLSIGIVGLINKAKNLKNMREAELASIAIERKIQTDAYSQPDTPQALSIENVNLKKNTSGRGVYQARITPETIFSSVKNTVTISAEIGSAEEVESVTLHNLSDSHALDPTLMNDSGEDGDIRAGDTVFSTEIIVQEQNVGSIAYEIHVLYLDDYKVISSADLTLTVENLQTTSEADINITDFSQSVQDEYAQYRNAMSADEARYVVLENILGNPHVSFADLEGFDLNVVYKGENIWIQLYTSLDGPPIDPR
jgi:hypothetical protein